MMAEQPKKPRNIKDLKKRLGRSGAPPAQIGSPAAPVPSGPAAPPGIAAPPFMKQPEAEPLRPSDPFAAVAPAAAPQEYRLVIDEKPVDDAEVGRRSRAARFILIGAGLAVGLLLGWGAGNMLKDRELYNLALQDGKDIYNSVQTAASTVNEGKRYVDAAVEAARGGPGKQPSADYQAISKLKQLERPFEADAFARRKYGAFDPQTVDLLFDYYNSVSLMWSRFDQLASRTAPSRRASLDQAAAAAANVTTQTGAIPYWQTIGEGENETTRLALGLVFVQPGTDESDPNQVQVSSTLRGRTSDKTVYSNQDWGDDPGDYVILIEPQRSVGVLGQQASVFAEYQRDLLELQQLVNRTIEVQGRLETELGDIAGLTELWTPF